MDRSCRERKSPQTGSRPERPVSSRNSAQRFETENCSITVHSHKLAADCCILWSAQKLRSVCQAEKCGIARMQLPEWNIDPSWHTTTWIRNVANTVHSLYQPTNKSVLRTIPTLLWSREIETACKDPSTDRWRGKTKDNSWSCPIPKAMIISFNVRHIKFILGWTVQGQRRKGYSIRSSPMGSSPSGRNGSSISQYGSTRVVQRS